MESSDVKNYEQLHDDYKKLMSEYEELISEKSDKKLIASKLDEIQQKHQEITDVFSNLSPKN